MLLDPQKYKLYPEMRHAKLSLAGAQDKLPVYIKGTEVYLPKNSGSATTHIIKPMNAGFNYIIGNHDAHGKNFSILYKKEFELAPFYDLVSTQVYFGQQICDVDWSNFQV